MHTLLRRGCLRGQRSVKLHLVHLDPAGPASVGLLVKAGDLYKHDISIANSTKTIWNETKYKTSQKTADVPQRFNDPHREGVLVGDHINIVVFMSLLQLCQGYGQLRPCYLARQLPGHLHIVISKTLYEYGDLRNICTSLLSRLGNQI